MLGPGRPSAHWAPSQGPAVSAKVIDKSRRSIMQEQYPIHTDPEKVDRRRWVRENLAWIQVAGDGLPQTIADVVRAIAHLAQPDRVLLFGSRARGDARHLSDYDLYVEGVRDRNGLRTAVLDSVGYLTLRTVDIVPDFQASASLKSEVEREGKVIYERPN